MGWHRSAAAQQTRHRRGLGLTEDEDRELRQRTVENARARGATSVEPGDVIRAGEAMGLPRPPAQGTRTDWRTAEPPAAPRQMPHPPA